MTKKQLAKELAEIYSMLSDDGKEKLEKYMADLQAENLTKPRYYTLQEVAEIYQIDERSVYRCIKDGRLPGMKLGRVWRFSQADLNAFDRVQRDKK